MADIRQVTGDPNEFWDEFDWADLSSAEQELWGKLGWNAASWDEETDPPEADDAYWEDLSPEARTALEKLGYTQASWDEE